MEVSGLDDEKLSLLAKWAAGLRTDPRPEIVAAGRAIELLIDEVERLNVLIWEGRLSTPRQASEAGQAHVEAPAEAEVLAPLRASLRQRIRGALQPNA